jgi:hypothetical protein
MELGDDKTTSVPAIYHITHITNVSAILRNGLLSLNEIRRRKFEPVSIAEPKVQNLRDRIWIEPAIGSRIINLHDFVPFYFVPKTPMLACRQDQQDNLVLIEVSADVLRRAGCLFTDGNAAVQGLSHRFPNVSVSVRVSTRGERCNRTFWENGLPRPWTIRRPVSQIYAGPHNLRYVNWKVLQAESWVEHPDGKRQRCAEVLFPRQVALTDFRRLIVVNECILERVRRELKTAGVSLPAEVIPSTFFSSAVRHPEPSLDVTDEIDTVHELNLDDPPF